MTLVTLPVDPDVFPDPLKFRPAKTCTLAFHVPFPCSAATVYGVTSLVPLNQDKYMYLGNSTHRANPASYFLRHFFLRHSFGRLAKLLPLLPMSRVPKLQS